MTREFIPNVDTANEEIVRLDAEIIRTQGETATVQAELKKAKDDLKAAQDLLDAAPKAETVQTLQNELKDSKEKAEKLDAEVKRLGPLADANEQRTVEAAAAAGVSAVKDAVTTGMDHLDDAKSASAGKTGIARAIAANIAIQASKKSVRS